MDIELVIRWAKGVVICAVAAWEVVQLSRRRDDLALRVLTIGLVLLAIAATFGIKTPVLEPIREFFGHNWTHIINGCWMSMAFCWAAYFLLADTDKPEAQRKRKALIELGVLVVALALMVFARESMPPGPWRENIPLDQRGSWQRTLWYCAVSGYSLFAWFLGVRRALVLRRRLHHPWARAAFWIVGAGSAAMALGVNGVSLSRQLIRLVDPSFDPDLFTVLYSTGQLTGQFVLALGLALAPLATLFYRARARLDRGVRARYSRRLLPLWQRLTTEFTYIPLRDVHTGQSGGDFERITTEITDGISELARDCPEPDGDIADPKVAAAVIADGLNRRAERRDARWAGDEDTLSEPPYPRLEPDFPDWRSRARWMLAVSDELHERGVIGKDEHERVGSD
ncbi:MAB_1171c family putative transporter [Amycolatopsis suaedae]|uniref:DUF6545 domain-containing protein n=1 Tax=Amycolatopsis suaedae TaxID=2510978 RepID=A0A4Q7IYW2_9PSEU|nr:MAB_1171c family putative transporter [Amycolatopsis suaedae]RZQ59659.1 hypothetical protein EWH70_33060 [Amycolatopsis suaedae]